MAASSLALSSSSLVTHVNATANSATDVNTNITALTNAFNASLETSTGHYHDGTDSRLMYGSIGGMTMDDFAMFCVMMAKGGRV